MGKFALTNHQRDLAQIFLREIKEILRTHDPHGPYTLHALNGILFQICKHFESSLGAEIPNNAAIMQEVFDKLKEQPELHQLLQRALIEPANLLERSIGVATVRGQNEFMPLIQVLLEQENALHQIQNLPIESWYQILKYKKVSLATSILTMIEKTPYINAVHFNKVDRQNRSLLHYAAMLGDAEIVRKLLRTNISSVTKDLYGYTALDYALFYGNLSAACLLSGKSEEILRKDPRFNHPPPRMNNGQLSRKILDYLMLKARAISDPTIQFDLPAISDGVCHGWAFLAGFYASRSSQECEKFYEVVNEFLKWDPQHEPLNEIPEKFKPKFSTRDEMFRDLIYKIYWFYQQSSSSFGVSRADRALLLKIIADNARIERLTDFGLRDLSHEEEMLVMKYYHPIMDECYVDLSAFSSQGREGHAVSCYQQSSNHIEYFDSNLEHRVPPFNNYEEVAKATHFLLEAEQIRFLALFHMHPEKLTPANKQKAGLITAELIQKLIFDHPRRRNDLQEILISTVQYGMADMLRHLLKYSEMRVELSNSLQYLFLADNLTTSYECYKIIYESGIDLSKLDVNGLEALLDVAIQYNDEEMHQQVSRVLRARLPEEYPPSDQATINEMVRSPQQQQRRSKVFFKFPAESRTPVRIVEEQKGTPQQKDPLAPKKN